MTEPRYLTTGWGGKPEDESEGGTRKEVNSASAKRGGRRDEQGTNFPDGPGMHCESLVDFLASPDVLEVARNHVGSLDTQGPNMSNKWYGGGRDERAVANSQRFIALCTGLLQMPKLFGYC